MQRLDLKQLLSQKLSPQQIQFIKLLQIPTAELETRIKEEMEMNPALEEGSEEDKERTDDEEDGDNDDDFDADDSLDEDFEEGSSDEAYEGPEDNTGDDGGDLDLDDYLHSDEIAGYKMQGDGPGEEEDRDMPLAGTSTLIDSLLDQLGFLNLDEEQEAIGMQLIGSIDNDGYIRRELSSIANDLAFSQNIEATEPEIEAVLRKIQTFDPAGIGARDLRECLLLQLERHDQDEDFLKYLVMYALNNCKDDLQFLNDMYDKELLQRLNFVVTNSFERLEYTQAVEILKTAKQKFEYPVEWGTDLQSEHERYLVEKHFKKPVILTNYPKHIKAFYMKQNEDGKTVRAMDVLFPGIGEIIGGSQREENYEKLAARIKEMGIHEEELWWYLELRKFGTAPHAGFGLGFERLILFITGMGNIRDVIPFPRFPKSATF